VENQKKLEDANAEKKLKDAEKKSDAAESQIYDTHQ